MRISIIGCGWLGLPLGEELCRQGYTVLGSTTHKEKMPQLAAAGIQPFQIQISPEGIRGEQLDHFFRTDILIVNIPPRSRRRTEVETEHPAEIRNLIEKAESFGIRKVLFISSTGVYANHNRVVTEIDPTHPTTASGKALVKIEEWLQQRPDLEVTLLRLAGLVGGERKAGRFLAGKTNLPNGAAPVNLIHREDCIGVIKAIIQQEQWGEVFNLCADEHPTREAFYTTQAQLQGFEAPQFKSDNELSYKIISNQKVKQRLNYQLRYPDPMAF